MDILRIIALVFVMAGLVWLTFREFEREHQRQELAKKNMSFINLLSYFFTFFCKADGSVNINGYISLFL